MQKIYAIPMSILLSVCLFGQEKKGKGPDNVSMAYFGEKIFHPGLSLGIDWQKPLSPPERNVSHNFRYGISVAGYLHPRNHLGLQLKPRTGYFITGKRGFEVGALAEAGYMKRFYQGQVFEVEDRTVRQNKWAGQNALVYGGYLHLAYGPGPGTGRKLPWFLRIGAFWEYPFNGGALMHPVVALGITKKLLKWDD